MKVQCYRPNWSWGSATDKWLRSICVGRVLNFPCGMSKIGDVRADIDPKVRPDVIDDLKSHHFGRESFDTVVCDPPFSLYNTQRWVPRIADIARKRVIFSSPIVLSLGKGRWTRSMAITVENNRKFIRNWFIFDRKVHCITGEGLPSEAP